MFLKICSPILILLLFSIQNVFASVITLPPKSTGGKCTSSEFDNCLNGVGPAASSTDNLKIASHLITDKTRRRKDEREEDLAQLAAGTGHSAGDGFSRWSVWGSYNKAEFDANNPLVNAVDADGNTVFFASYDTDLDGFTIGTDTIIGSNFLVGLALSYEQMDTSTDFNGGDADTDGFTVTPYAAYLINDNFSIDIAAGYSSLDYDTDRIDNTDGSNIRGDFDSDRWFTTANLNANFNYQNWFLGGRIGYIYSKEEQDSYTETGGPTARAIRDRDVDLSQFVVGIDAAYSFGAFEPYGVVTYLNDISRDEGGDAGGLPGGVVSEIADDDEVQYGFGVRYFGDYLSGAFEWTTTVGRTHFDGDAWLFTLRADL